ncbi:flagellar filament capping protein FliD [Pseudoxanthomonas composti]|uniref:Flagellar hook-associated protein 2 n=1 Tax=Pseudoxanthomonas composti TaxID=2137479 RepID=A0A4Q1JSF4_9GAMM|nr:flagellar filament capping protein FliD [Pseudoxanthomonas composti]RXR02671.1 flagellar protein [Pseudoxanthomonas composti]
MALGNIGTGMDINSVVAQLVAAERAPAQNRITRSGEQISTKLSALGTVKSVMTNLQTALTTLTSAADKPAQKTSVAADAGFTATASTDAVTGSYSVEVVNLASAHKLTSTAVAAGTTLGAGTMQVKAGDKTYDIEIAEGASLADVAKAINAKSGGAGVSASVINAADGQHLVFNATTAGQAGALTVTTSGGDLARFAYDPANSNTQLSQTTAAANAKVKIDGLEVSSTSNELSDAIPGINLSLTKAKPGETFAVSVARDNATLKTNLQSFVSAYNAAVNTLASSSAYNSATQTASSLTGDSMVRSMQSQMRGLVSGQVNDLKALGVTIAKDGTLSLDSGKLDTAMSSTPEKMAGLFGKSGTIGTGLTSMLKGVLDSGNGSLTSRTKSLNSQLDSLNDQLSDLDARMEKVKARYTAQFTAMEQLATQMQTTSSYLTQQFSTSSS